MLTLQRASAGSGKTYTLTKTFIRQLIVTDLPGQAPRLRTMEELEDALPHILAVTFTNKATNEMKQRIISKLFDLSLTDTPEEKTDYLQDFMTEFGATRLQIAQRCKAALKYLLLNYSDFNVSTIDAFFQTVLRTFAYEAELPETYNLEIDSEYINKLGVDTTIDCMQSNRLDTKTLHWLDDAVNRARGEGRNVNLMQKRSTSRFSSETLYQTLLKIARQLSSETFKDAEKTIDDYFNASRDLRTAIHDIDLHFIPLIESRYAALRKAALRLSRAYRRLRPASLLSIARDKAIPRLARILAEDADPTAPCDWEILTPKKSPLNKQGSAALTEADKNEIRELYDAVSDAYTIWLESFAQPHWTTWAPIRELLPQLALLATFRNNVRQILEEGNTMVLADTNTLLRRVIADDDVPFIYERLGTRLRHFFIDEFQDTSSMQWENFRPLLQESIGTGYDNLIIGDAKQSIYRFRNADASIITRHVPQAFDHNHIRIRGDKVEENANWRSDPRIVRFNNFFFRCIHDTFDSRLDNLYAGAVQQPKRTKNNPDRGYVCWSTFEYQKSLYDRQTQPQDESAADAVSDAGPIGNVSSDKESADKASTGNEEKNKAGVEVIGPMISDMMRRGYRQKDIAVLCNTNDTGKSVIEALIAYNLTLPEQQEKIRFVSDQSLELQNNNAVNTVISALRLIAEGVYVPPRDGAVHDDKPAKMSRFNRFVNYAQSRAGLPLGETLAEFMLENDQRESLTDMIAKMQSTTLPAIVEAIIDKYVHADKMQSGKSSDTPFLAALQDAVIDYCRRYCADITSFLDWWEKVGKTISISSPENSDAINIMTIHKAKGLEFECVILPDLTKAFKPKGGDWAWVEIPDNFPYKEMLPQRVPVMLKDTLLEPFGLDHDSMPLPPGPFAPQWLEEVNLTLADNLNRTYVAMTRPVSELYILHNKVMEPEKASGKKAKEGDAPKETPKDVNACLTEYLRHLDQFAASLDQDERHLFIDPAEVTISEGNYVAYGTPPTDEEIARRYRDRTNDKEASGQETETLTENIKGYYVNADQPMLQYVEDGPTPPKPDDEDTADPRSEGNLIHSILERVITYDDLHRAIEHLRIRGLLLTPQAEEMERQLAHDLETTRHTCWFDGSCRVMTERPVMHRERGLRRPDRVMVTEEGRAIVVDYKTGDMKNIAAHRRQVSAYMDMLRRTGLFTEVEGWLWYVRKHEIVQV